MGKGTYNGGNTVVHAGSGFFSFKGSGKRKNKPALGSDEPGDAKPGSICDFRPIKGGRKKARVVEFPKNTDKMRREEKQLRQVARASNRVLSVANRTLKAVERSNQNIHALRQLLSKAEDNHNVLLRVAERAASLTAQAPDESVIAEIERSLVDYEPNKLLPKTKKK